MKNKFRILSLLCAVIALASCKEDNLLNYESESNVYFRQKKWTANSSQYFTYMTYEGKDMSVRTAANVNGVVDSVQISMARVHEDLRSDTTFLPVTVMGDIMPVNRPIAFRIIDAKDGRGAVEGVDFRILDAYIPANREDGGIVIEMFRDVFEADEVKTIDFELLPNDHFSTNYKWINQSTTDTTKVSMLTMRLTFTDGLGVPPSWKNVVSFLGVWSVRKAYVLVYELGMDWDFLYSAAFGYAENRFIISTYGNALKKWLQNYKDTHGEPYYEADGVTEMTAGTSASS